MYVVDLCCGIGGLSLAAQSIGHDPFIGIDSCKNALATFSANFPRAIALHADMMRQDTPERLRTILRERKVSNEELIVVSGPPCQGFSIAGPRQLEDPRNSVILQVARLIAHVRPKFALIENVSAIKHPRYRRKLKTFERIIVSAGYFLLDLEVNAQDFGVSQRRRRRLFFVTRNKVSTETCEQFLGQLRVPATTVKSIFEGLPPATVWDRASTADSTNRGLFNHFAMNHSREVQRKIAKIPRGTGPFSYRKLDPDKVAPTLVAGHRAPPVHFKENRGITTREAARIQGFPDSFRIYGSFGSQLQQVANAVPPNLGMAALRTLVHLGE